MSAETAASRFLKAFNWSCGAVLVVSVILLATAANDDTTDPAPVSELLSTVDRGDMSEFDVLTVADATCVRFDQGWTSAQVIDEWTAAGWSPEFITQVVTAVTDDPAYCVGTLPRLVVDTTESGSMVG